MFGMIDKNKIKLSCMIARQCESSLWLVNHQKSQIRRARFGAAELIDRLCGRRLRNSDRIEACPSGGALNCEKSTAWAAGATACARSLSSCASFDMVHTVFLRLTEKTDRVGRECPGRPCPQLSQVSRRGVKEQQGLPFNGEFSDLDLAYGKAPYSGQPVVDLLHW